MKKHFRKTKSFSVTVPRELVGQIDRRASEVSRSRSSYITWLVSRDIDLLDNKIKSNSTVADIMG